MKELDGAALRVEAGLQPDRLLIAAEASYSGTIPSAYEKLYSIVPQSELLAYLETADTHFTAVSIGKGGRMNGALFCEELVQYLLAQYPERFFVLEKTPIHTIALREDSVELTSVAHTITGKDIVLCTNGVERFMIQNLSGPDIETKFHHLVRGYVDYMAAYFDPRNPVPGGICYVPAHLSHSIRKGEEAYVQPYFYLNRASYHADDGSMQTLVCIGGPEAIMDDTTQYRLQHPYPNEAQAEIDAFLHTTHARSPAGDIPYAFRWHGLMGYTPNGVRSIGYEPCNPRLLYNLGCNGIGMLPSIYGGRRIAALLAGESVRPSLFDPKDSR